MPPRGFVASSRVNVSPEAEKRFRDAVYAKHEGKLRGNLMEEASLALVEHAKRIEAELAQ